MKRIWFLLLVTALGGLIYAVYTLKITEVRVVGLRALPAKSVIEASGLKPGERILWVRLSSAARGVERLPAISSAVAERSLPGTIVIRVTERTPLARLDSAPRLGVDEHGVTFDLGQQQVTPVLHGWRGPKGKTGSGVRLDARTRTVLDAYARFPQAFINATREITIRPTLVIRLSGGTEVRFGALDSLVLKATEAVAVIRSQKPQHLVYVDVSSPSAPASRDTTPITPPPTPSPLPGTSAPPVATPTPAPPSP